MRAPLGDVAATYLVALEAIVAAPLISIVLDRASWTERHRWAVNSGLQFLPAVPKEANARDTGRCRCVCVATLKPVPMLTRNYPSKVFDYMAAGRPTVLLIDGIMRKVVEEGRAGVCVPPGDAETLARTILRLHGDPAWRERMGARAREYVKAHFNRPDQAQVLERALVDAVVQRQLDGLFGWKRKLSSLGSRLPPS